MSLRRGSLFAAGALAALVAASGVSVPAPGGAQQIVNCPQQPAPTQQAGQQPIPQNARLTAQQRQSLCIAADALERHTAGLTLDLANALFPGAIGPAGPLTATDLAAHTQSPESGALFDATVGAATAGLSGSILANGALIGYLRSLTLDTPDPNFQPPVQPVVSPIVFPSPAPETNQAVAGAFESLLTNEVQAVAVAQALTYAVRRAQGAAQAGNTQISQQHLRTAGLLAVQLATLLNRETRQRIQVQQALLTQSLPVSYGDPAVAQALDGAAIALVQFGQTQGVQPPVPPPPFPPSVPVQLPRPPAPPPAPPVAPSEAPAP
jgi:hypothetical protein